MGTIKKRVVADGTARYDARVHRSKGTGKKSSTVSKSFEKESEARTWINKIEHRIDNRQSISRAGDEIRLAEGAAAYLVEARAMSKAAKAKAAARAKEAAKTPSVEPEKVSNVAEHERMKVSAIVEDLGHYHISDITHQVIQHWIDEFLKRPIPFQKRAKVHPYFEGGLTKDGKQKLYAKGTVRGHFFVLKKLLIWIAVTNRFQLDPNLFLMLDIPPAWADKRERRLEDGEEAKLREAMTRGYAKQKEWDLLMTFTLETAARMQEILKAKWIDVSYKRQSWNIPEENVKTSVFRNVPLSAVAIDALKAMEAFKVEGESRIFHQWKDSSTLSKAWRRVVKRAEVEDFHFHDLRHEAVVRFFENTDLTDTEIMSITGHTSHEMLKAYSQHRTNKLAARLNGMKRTA